MDYWSRKLAIFLVLTVALSMVLWAKIIAAETLGVADGLYVLALMWCPGVAALLTRLITQRDWRGQGWALGRPKALGTAYALPIVYASPVYGLVWTAHLGGFAPNNWAAGAPMVGAASSPVAGLAMAATVGVVVSLLSATGEEIGWRGYLVPVLAERFGKRATLLLSSLIWAAWHLPLIIFADYGAGTPLWWGIPCFVVMILGLGAVLGWLRVTSGSLWPAALLHASHNLFVEGVFDGATVNLRWTRYLTGEFGIGLVITIGIAAWLLTRRWLAARP